MAYISLYNQDCKYKYSYIKVFILIIGMYLQILESSQALLHVLKSETIQISNKR